MPDGWVVVQVGPVLQVPRQARFHNKQGWWYVYRRSSTDDGALGRGTDAWGSTKYPTKSMALDYMHLDAERLHMPWCLVRQLSGQEGHIVAYFQTKAAGELWRPFRSDVMMRPGWEKGDEDATRL